MQSFTRKFSIGRDRNCDVAIADESVSRAHAELVVSGSGNFFLIDCRSRNGTAVVRNGRTRSIVQEFVVPEDTVQFGEVMLSVGDMLDAIAIRYPELFTKPAPPEPSGRSAQGAS